MVVSDKIVQIKFIFKYLAKSIEVKSFMGIKLFFCHFLCESWDLPDRLAEGRKIALSRPNLLILWFKSTASFDVGHRPKINQPTSMITIHHDIDLL